MPRLRQLDIRQASFAYSCRQKETFPSFRYTRQTVTVSRQADELLVHAHLRNKKKDPPDGESFFLAPHTGHGLYIANKQSKPSSLSAYWAYCSYVVLTQGRGLNRKCQFIDLFMPEPSAR